MFSPCSGLVPPGTKNTPTRNPLLFLPTERNLNPFLKQWIFECLDARFLITTIQLWSHKPTLHTPSLYPEISASPPFPDLPRLALGLLNGEEWQTIPGLFKQQNP